MAGGEKRIADCALKFPSVRHAAIITYQAGKPKGLPKRRDKGKLIGTQARTYQ